MNDEYKQETIPTQFYWTDSEIGQKIEHARVMQADESSFILQGIPKMFIGVYIQYDTSATRAEIFTAFFFKVS